MNQQEYEDILLVGKFMGVNNLFPYYFEPNEIAGVYIAEDETGWIDYVDVGIDWFAPNSDWNTLKPIIDKCFKELEKLGFDKRYSYSPKLGYAPNIVKLNINCTIEQAWECVINAIKYINKYNV